MRALLAIFKQGVILGMKHWQAFTVKEPLRASLKELAGV
jgi:hypothetical protein